MIEVELNDVTHELKGNIKMEYTNHSPDELPFIWFHLWPNAYRNLNTAFAKQQLENGSTTFYFSKPEQRGYIDSLSFQADGKILNWKIDSVHIDICKVFLPKPLKSGESITITTPFLVKIPGSFSRLGHTGQAYQITQWYPKPAVYDKYGWHPMPYLDQGEFYSEFGSFDVKITLPKNYVVGASGNLQNEEELQWLNELAEKTAKQTDFGKDTGFPPSDSLTKTLHYKLENAHDFAWFADKRFHVLKGEVTLPHSGKKVTTWAMFTNQDAELWRKSLEYIHDAIYYYSKWIGDYAYDQVTAVEGALSAGRGMEYPTITIIGKAGSAPELETIIVHEVGHNWFYGMLGTNERDHAWMDEGINSFYEMRCLGTKYPGKKWLESFDAPRLRRFLDIDDYPLKFLNELLYLYNARQHLDQPIALKSTDFTPGNYATIVYAKTALLFDHLKAYLGDSLFDHIMQQYFEEWKFKHPMPEDLRMLFESASGKNLSWFFDELIATNNKVDYKISSVKKDKINNIHTLTLTNKTGVASPVPVSAIRKDTIAKTIWVDGFEGSRDIEIVNDNYHHYRIDADRITPELNRKNNNYRLRGMLHKAERLRFQMFGSIENPNKAQLFFTPVAGWNNYDKTLVGIAFYNHFLPFKNFEFELVPLFGTGSVEFAGIGRIGYTFCMKRTKIHNISLSVHGKRFSYDLFPDGLSYNKVQPVLTLGFRKKNPRSREMKFLSLRTVVVWQEYRRYNTEIRANENVISHYFVNEAVFYWNNSRVINPCGFNLALQQGNNFVRTFGEFSYQLTYNSRNKGLFVRLFAGGFVRNDRDASRLPDPRFRMNFSTGKEQFQKDFLFDEYFFGRNQTDGLASQQIVTKEGGFRSHNDFGQSDEWLASVSFSSAIPGKIPIRPYTSIGLYGEEGVSMAYELGLAAVIVPGIFEIYFPLVSLVRYHLPDGTAQTRKWYPGLDKNDSVNLYSGEKYRSLITFQFNIRKMNPFELIKQLPF
ncbi:MAG TPA: M1 family metallopeptidase [Chitinophagales bacterium]|nr:M1 family metallopeptidase [Chitinophagales bacterium]